jgi:6-phospho-beta-glucosidase
MRVTLIGGGGFRTPYLYHELLRDPEPIADELVLFDTDESRLRAIGAVLEGQAGDRVRPRVIATTDLRAALTGADVVFTAVRVGGLERRAADERIAASLGLVGQETTGAGGVAYAIRTVPVMVDYARRIAEHAPDALVVNFTNPAGIITEAMQAVLGARVVGVCDTPSSLVRRVAEVLGVDPDAHRPDYIGLNHLGWLRGYRSAAGVDLLPGLLASDALLSRLEETEVFGARWIRALGAIPNEYLHYYYDTREARDGMRDGVPTRGESLRVSQGDLFAALEAHPADPAAVWLEAVRDRNASYMADARDGSLRSQPGSDDAIFADGYAGVAVDIVRAILRGAGGSRGSGGAGGRTMILNVPNGSTIAGLPEDAVVEVTSVVDRSGIAPLSTAAPTLHQLGLMQQVKAVERLAIRAGLTGDRDAAFAAFAGHPLVDSLRLAERLMHEYEEQIPEFAAVFRPA